MNSNTRSRPVTYLVMVRMFLTRMIANAGPTKAQITPLCIDNQQLKRKRNIMHACICLVSNGPQQCNFDTQTSA